jgi:hypothetical protein
MFVVLFYLWHRRCNEPVFDFVLVVIGPLDQLYSASLATLQTAPRRDEGHCRALTFFQKALPLVQDSEPYSGILEDRAANVDMEAHKKVSKRSITEQHRICASLEVKPGEVDYSQCS